MNTPQTDKEPPCNKHGIMVRSRDHYASQRSAASFLSSVWSCPPTLHDRPNKNENHPETNPDSSAQDIRRVAAERQRAETANVVDCVEQAETRAGGVVVI